LLPVLPPFANPTAGAAQKYFADGMAEGYL